MNARSDTEQSPAERVRGLLLRHHDATLCTLSADPAIPGYPFGSVVPFQTTGQGAPFILISRIAQHTRNLLADPRASVFVARSGGEGDPQQGWRITLSGRMHRYTAQAPQHERDRPVGEEALARLHARYLAVVPRASGYFGTHAFDYWGMDLERVRFIGGFGEIHWIEAASVLRDPLEGGLSAGAAGIIRHMNEAHPDALVDYCVGLRGHRPERAELVAVDATGFFVRTPERLEYFGFEREISSASARHAFVDLLKKARSIEPPTSESSGASGPDPEGDGH